MKLKLLLFTALLMFVVLTGILLYKGSVLLYDIEDEVISYLEDNYQIKLEVKETSFWPVNQIMLKESKISSTNNQFTVTVPEISIYYDLFALLTAGGNPGNSIDFISLKEPLIEINQVTNSDRDIHLSESEIEKRMTEFLGRVYMTSPLQVEIEEGVLSYNSSKNNLELERFNLLLKVISEDESRIQLNTDIAIDNVTLSEYKLADIELESLELVMQVRGNSWQGSLETNYIDLADIGEYIVLENSPINYEGVGGIIKPRLSFHGVGLSLEDYKGKFSVLNGEGSFSLQSYALKADILTNNLDIEELGNKRFDVSRLNGDLSFDSVNGKLSTDELVFKLNGSDFKFNGRAENLTTNQEPELFGHLRAGQLDITVFDLLPEEVEFEGLMVMDLTVEGTLSDLDMNLDFSLSEGELNDLKIENMVTTLRYYQGNTYLDQLNFIVNETNQFTMSGLIKNESQEYS
ncbi:MAG: hypothetical protein ACLFUI_06260, partial [Halanaerobiales bacterium]